MVKVSHYSITAAITQKSILIDGGTQKKDEISYLKKEVVSKQMFGEREQGKQSR